MSDAINTQDVEAFVSCLTHDYKGEQPLHPEIASIGLAQVRENWTALFAQIYGQLWSLQRFTAILPGLNGTGKVRARPDRQ
jgi:SnoaL-like domain